MEKKKPSALAIIGLASAIISLLIVVSSPFNSAFHPSTPSIHEQLGASGYNTAVYPIISSVSVASVFSLIATILFALTGFKSRSKIAIFTAALVVIVWVIVLGSIVIRNNDLRRLSQNIDIGNSAENTNEPSKNDIDIKFGMFNISTDESGLNTTWLPVTITNNLTETKSYTIVIKALDRNGNQIAQDTIHTKKLGASQQQAFKTFQHIEPGKLEQMKTATFKIDNISKS